MDIKQNIAKTIAANVGADAAELCEWLETPPNPDMGDVAFPCFKLAKTMRKAPNMIAASLAPALGEINGISRIEPMGGYINFFADKTSFARTTLERVLDESARYGGSDVGSGKTVCLDYSSINIAKPFHIGHLSTTAIGNALRRIYDHLGYKTVSINHLGDWGTQFGKMILAYKLWGDKETVEKGGVRAMMQLYVRFHDEAEKDDSLNDSARTWFKRIEQHDPEAVEIFEWFKAITLKEVGKTYDLLGIKFDSYAGESFYEDKMQPVIDELREKHLLKVDNGASIVDLSEYSMPPCLILRSDGATLYATRDLAAAIYRKNTYDFDKLLYVVAYQQSLHFKQIFKVLELMGKDWVKDCVHVSFGMVSLTDGTLSTRHGRVVFLEDVLNAAIEKTLDVIKEKSPDLEDKETVARQIGVGAVVWGVVYNGRIKDIVFSWDKALNFDGETGPYAQYTHARCCSVLRKSGGYDRAKIDYSALSDEASSALVKAIAEFPSAVSEAAEKYEPYIISRSVINVCSCFNKFYYDNRIMDENEGVRNARLALTDAARNVIKTGLYLVGLEAPEKM